MGCPGAPRSQSAREIYNSRNDLSTICSADDFRKPASEHLSTGILFGTAFHPMLCGRFDASGHVVSSSRPWQRGCADKRLELGGGEPATAVSPASQAHRPPPPRARPDSSSQGIRVCEKMVTPAGRPAPFAIEDKLDGERLLVHKDGATITCFTRRTTDYTATYEPVLREAIVTGVKAHRAILDGEMLAFDSTTGEFLKFGENRTVAEEEARGASGSKTMVSHRRLAGARCWLWRGPRLHGEGEGEGGGARQSARAFCLLPRAARRS